MTIPVTKLLDRRSESLRMWPRDWPPDRELRLAVLPADEPPVREREVDRHRLLVPDQPAFAPHILGPHPRRHLVGPRLEAVDGEMPLEGLVALARPLLRGVGPAVDIAGGVYLDLRVDEGGKARHVPAAERLEDLPGQFRVAGGLHPLESMERCRLARRAPPGAAAEVAVVVA